MLAYFKFACAKTAMRHHVRTWPPGQRPFVLFGMGATPISIQAWPWKVLAL